MANYRLRFGRTNALKLKVSTRLPASVVATDGISASVSGGVLRIGENYGSLIDDITDFGPENTYLKTWNAVTGTYSRTSYNKIINDAARAGGAGTALINLCTNPGMQVWQNDRIMPAMTHRTVLADGWLFGTDGGAVWQGARSTDVPSAVNVPYSLDVQCTTAAATPINAHLRWAVFGADFAPFKDGDIQLKFWVKAKKPGIYCVVANNSTPRDASYIAEYTINSADTWEQKSITIPFASRVGSLWNYDQGYGFGIRWALTATSGGTAAVGWNNGNYQSSPNQVNAGDSTSNYFRITAVQIYGVECPPFTLPSYDAALSSALRQYRVVDTDIGGINLIGSAPTADSANFDVQLPIPMMAPPTVSIKGALDTDLLVQSAAGTVSVTGTALTSYARSKNVAKWAMSKTGGFTPGSLYVFRLNTPSGKLVFDGHLA